MAFNLNATPPQTRGQRILSLTTVLGIDSSYHGRLMINSLKADFGVEIQTDKGSNTVTITGP